jgi:hypothetical protein
MTFRAPKKPVPVARYASCGSTAAGGGDDGHAGAVHFDVGVGAAIAIGAIALPINVESGHTGPRRRSGFQHGHRRRHDGQSSAVRYVSEVVSWYPISITIWAVGVAIYIVCAWTMEYIPHQSTGSAARRIGHRYAARLLGSMIEAMAS